VERHDGLAEHLSSLGMHPVSVDEALERLGRVLAHGGEAVQGCFAVDGPRIAAALPRQGQLLSALAGQGATSRTAAVRTLDALPPEERRSGLGLALRGLVATVLRLAPERLPTDEPLTAVGIDSIVASEVVVALQRQLGVSVSTMRLLDDTTLDTLGDELAGHLWESRP
jgi:phthiocerol/phenolphthiocerol synthesis type-I polyketide synthase C